MVAATAARAMQHGVKNIVVEQRDFVSEGCGRNDQAANLVLLFNILHIEDPVGLLKEARRVLCDGVGSPSSIGSAMWRHREDRRSLFGPGPSNAGHGAKRRGCRRSGRKKTCQARRGIGECSRRGDLATSPDRDARESLSLWLLIQSNYLTPRGHSRGGIERG